MEETTEGTALKTEVKEEVTESVAVEEDVPSDFFDAFSNNDFMAGLDIVDAWDEVDTASSGKKGGLTKKEAENVSADKSASKARRDELDQRRDPEKTKRDIQKYKEKCAKDKKAKIISEKLKVVETGLVPPGMEMEVDLKELTKDKKVAKQPSLHKEKERFRKSKSSEAHHRPRVSPTHRNARHVSPFRRIPRYVSPLRRSPRHVSPLRRSPRHVSPLRRSPRHVSPLRRSPRPFISARRGFGPRRHSARSRDRHSPDRSYGRGLRLRSRSRSPYRPRNSFGRKRESSDSFEMSPSPTEAARRRYLRRKASTSPTSSTRNNEFLEEIAIKLREERKKKHKLMKVIRGELNKDGTELKYPADSLPDPQMHVSPSPNVHFMPPMPGQPQFFPQPQSDPLAQYDEQYFIGTSNPLMPNYPHPPPNYPNPNFMPNPSMMPPFQSPFFPNPGPPGPLGPGQVGGPPLHVVEAPPCNNVNVLASNKLGQTDKYGKVVNKLFADKKISLSDFLSITAKDTNSSTPASIQKKIQVISLCQDAIKTLGGESNLGGRFFLKRLPREPEEDDKKQETMFPSPLRKRPIVRFAFTTPSKGGTIPSLQTNLSKLLSSLGLVNPPRNPPVEVPITPTILNLPLIQSPNITVQPQPYLPPASSIPAQPKRFFIDPYKSDFNDAMSGKKHKMKMCQTDPVVCEECNNRKSRKFESKGTQCDLELTSAGTQTEEEDVPRPSPIKNQSLAHLTTAQLLKESFSSGRDAVSPPNDVPLERKFQDFPSKPNAGNSGKRPNIPPMFESRKQKKSFDHFESSTRGNFKNPRQDRYDERSRFDHRFSDDMYEAEDMYEVDDFGGEDFDEFIDERFEMPRYGSSGGTRGRGRGEHYVPRAKTFGNQSGRSRGRARGRGRGSRPFY